MIKQQGLPGFFPENEKQKNAIVLDKQDDNENDFNALSWVLRARSKEKKPQELGGCYSDGMGKFAATDGHRLHVAEIPGLTEKIPKGIWLFVHETAKQISIKEPPDSIANFPDFERLTDISENHEKKGVMTDLDETSLVWMFRELTGKECNIFYLFDICKGCVELDVWASPEKASPVFFCWESGDGDTRKAILMPLKDQRVS